MHINTQIKDSNLKNVKKLFLDLMSVMFSYCHGWYNWDWSHWIFCWSGILRRISLEKVLHYNWWSTHINRQFIYKSDAASLHQGTNRESEKISKWIGQQHWFFSSLSLLSLRCEIGCEEFDVLHLRNKTDLWQA